RVSGTGNQQFATCSIGSKLSLQRGPNFREGMGNGLRLRITRTTATNPKQQKESHEKSKYSVQTNSRTSHPAAPRLLCGNVYLGLHSGSSPRHGALQWHCLGVRRVSVRHGVRAFNTR